jgi:uncharacterized protein YciU (UPF0263 family)
MDNEKTKVRINRRHCMCLGCQEQGTVEFFDERDWCKAFEVVGSYEIWKAVVIGIRKSKELEIVYDNSGIEEEQEDQDE